MDMINPSYSEEEISYAIPTPGAMTQDDLEENEMKIIEADQEDQPQQGEDPTPKLGGNP